MGNPPYNLAVLSLGAERRTEPLVHTEFNEQNAEISPDGRWLAYESDESGQREVYVRPFPNVNEGRWQVSSGGGTRPLWARNGQELFYLSIVGADAALMRVPVERGATWTAGGPTKLFAGRFFYSEGGPGQGRTYDVSPDGRRFLMVKDSSNGNPSDAPSARLRHRPKLAGRTEAPRAHQLTDPQSPITPANTYPPARSGQSQPPRQTIRPC